MSANKSPQQSSDHQANNEFLEHFKDALEYWNDEDWLESQSHLTAIYLVGTKNRAKAFKELIRNAHSNKLALQFKDYDLQALLNIRFFAEDKNGGTKGEALKAIKKTQQKLGMAGGNYYMLQKKAIELLAKMFLKELKPVLLPLMPIQNEIIGRNNEEQLISNHLQQLFGDYVTLCGPSGIGKTSLASVIFYLWQNASKPAFWYTFHLGVNDQLEQLIFSLAYFLHQQGHSHLWAQLISQPSHAFYRKPNLALTMMRHALTELRFHHRPALLCFDEVDLLLSHDLNDALEHRRIREFLMALIEQTSGAKIIFIGQRLLSAPITPTHILVELKALSRDDITSVLNKDNLSLTPAEYTQIQQSTHGNPLLLRMFVALHHSGENISDTLRRLGSNFSLDWFLARLWRHLSDIELQVIQELATFEIPVNRHIWNNPEVNQALSQLIIRKLVDEDLVKNLVWLPQIFRESIYRRIPSQNKLVLQLWAAAQMEKAFEFTLAAQHYIWADRFDLAVWVWRDHEEQEAKRGRSGAALEILRNIEPSQLPNADDRRVWALSVSTLLRNIGETEEALEVLETATWLSGKTPHIKAQELRADLFIKLGQIDSALEEYRKTLNSITLFELQISRIRAHTQIGSVYILREPDPSQAQTALDKAQIEVEIQNGRLQDYHGTPTQARRHLLQALSLAEVTKDKQILARVHEQLGVLEAHQENLTQAEFHLQESGKYYRNCGLIAAAMGGVNTNLSCAYIMARQYAKAIEPAEAAIQFFEAAKQPYWVALNLANLAEAHFYLNHDDQAERCAYRGLNMEETVVRAYCLYVLGHIERQHGHFEAAEKNCLAAIQAAQETHDLWAEGPAYRALGEVYRDWGKTVDAQQAFDKVLNIYRKLGVQKEVDYIITHYPLSNSELK